MALGITPCPLCTLRVCLPAWVGHGDGPFPILTWPPP